MRQICFDQLIGAGYHYIGLGQFVRPDDDLAIAQERGRLRRTCDGFSRHGYCDHLGFSGCALNFPRLLPDVVKHSDTSVVTIERYIIEQERAVPEATGELSGLLYDIALACKMIANKVRLAGLADVLGAEETENVQGEVQQKLDVIANTIIVKAMDHGGRLCAMASEEEEHIIPIPKRFRRGKYLLLFDPLDGSSDIDVNVPVGTIFSVL
jgi:hypothetical protein